MNIPPNNKLLSIEDTFNCENCKNMIEWKLVGIVEGLRTIYCLISCFESQYEPINRWH